MVSLMQNEGKTDFKKTMITILSNDFSDPSESQICEISIVRSTNQSTVHL